MRSRLPCATEQVTILKSTQVGIGEAPAAIPCSFCSPNPSRASRFGRSCSDHFRFEEAIVPLCDFCNLHHASQTPSALSMAPELGLRISIRCHYGAILPSLVPSSPHYTNGLHITITRGPLSLQIWQARAGLVCLDALLGC
jgi:hypothetical protein